jgi:hypothetical protein
METTTPAGTAGNAAQTAKDQERASTLEKLKRMGIDTHGEWAYRRTAALLSHSGWKCDGSSFHSPDGMLAA